MASSPNRAFFEHGLSRIQIRVFKARHLGQRVDFRQMLDVEQKVLDGGFVVDRCFPESTAGS